VTVRVAAAGDAAAAVRIVVEALREHGIEADPRGRDADLATFGAGGALDLVAEEGGVVVGVASLEPRGNGEGWLRKLFVAADARRRGVGRELLARAVSEARARRIRRLGLRTRDVFVAAIRLYEREGWRRGEDPAPGERTYALLIE
jgi:GNAT superfamily N-acetyltransferase